MIGKIKNFEIFDWKNKDNLRCERAKQRNAKFSILVWKTDFSFYQKSILLRNFLYHSLVSNIEIQLVLFNYYCSIQENLIQTNEKIWIHVYSCFLLFFKGGILCYAFNGGHFMLA